MTNIFRKIFESLLMDYINQYLPNHFRLCGNQAGFKKGYSTLTHAIVSNETAKVIPHQYHAFLDLKKAYDSVPIKILLEKLEDRNIPGGILSLITSLFTECKTRVIVNKKITKEINLSRGLMQGSILSPLLFNIFIDDLARKLTLLYPNDPLPHCLFFADDIKLNHPDPNHLQKMLFECSKWADENGMEFNEKKSAILSDTSISSFPFILIKNKKKINLPVVPSYKYLGFTHTCKGIDWKENLDNSAKKAYGILKSLFFYRDIWPESVKLIIFRTFIRPTMEYSAGLAFYWMTKIDQLKNKSGKPIYSEVPTYHKVMEQGVQWILNHNRISNASCLLLLPSTIMRLYTLALKFRVHLSKMDNENPLYLAFHPKKKEVPPLSPFTFAHKINYWNSLFKDYKYFNLPPPPEPESKVEKKNHNLNKISLRINKMIQNHFNSLIMDKCILPSARITKNNNNNKVINSLIKSPDKCIFIRNRVIRKRAISWRLNAIGSNRICPICGDTFKRSHINKCKFIFIPPYNKIINNKDILRYKKDLMDFPKLPESYNILDSLLNHQKYKKFGLFMDKLFIFWCNYTDN